MIDLDTRARAAASGLRRAADRFALPEPTPSRAPRSGRVIVVVAALIFVGVLAIAWVSTRATTRVQTVTTRPTRIVGTKVGGSPIAIAIDKRGAFVATQRKEVVRLDLRTGAELARIPTGREIHGVVSDPRLGVWAFGGGDGADQTGVVVALDRSTNRRRLEIPLLDGAPTGIAFARGAVWVAQRNAHLRKLDPGTGRTLLEIATGANDSAPGQLLSARGRLWLNDSPRVLGFDPENPTARPARLEGGNIEKVAWDGTSLLTRECGETCYVVGRTRTRETRYYEAFGDLATADGVAWVISPNQSRIQQLDDQRVGVDIPRDPQPRLGDQPRYLTVGGSAAWYAVPERGRVYRIPLP